jgi:hypothetical protein
MAPSFIATASTECARSSDDVFAAATTVESLSRWVSFLRNVRVPEGAALGLGSIFLADEGFAEKSGERDHRFKVTGWTPGAVFSFVGLDADKFEGRLELQGNSRGSRITWTTSGTPGSTTDRIMASIMRNAVQKQATRQAAVQLENLRRLVEG